MLWYLKLVKNHPAEAKHALKTAIACIIAIATYLYFNIPQGYWIVISALLVMQSSLETGHMESTARAGYERIIGTAIGAVIGLLGYFLVSHNEWLNLPVDFVIVFITTYFIEHFAGYQMAAATAIIVMLISSHYQEPWDYALYRSLSILLGCCIAVVTTITIFPYRAKEELRKELANTLQQIGKFYQILLSSYIAQKSPSTKSKSLISRIQRMLSNNKDMFAEITSRKLGRTPTGYTYHTILTIEENIFNALLQMHQAEKKVNPERVSQEITQCLIDLQKPISQFFHDMTKKILDPNLKISNIKIKKTILRLQLAMEKLPTSHKEASATLEENYQFLALCHNLQYTSKLLLELEQKLIENPNPA